MLDFPNAPSVGTLYPQPAVVGVPVYRWDGIAWSTQGAPLDKTPVYTDGSTPMTAQLKLVGDPIALTDASDKNYVDNSLGKAVRYDAVQALTDPQKVQARQNIYAAPFDAMEYNGFGYNGGMDISQQFGNTLVNCTSNFSNWLCDGFGVWFLTSNAMAVSMQQIAPPGAPAFGSAFPNCIQAKVVTPAAYAAGDSVYIHHRLEGYRVMRAGFGTAAAQPVTVAFWVYATIAGTMPVAIHNTDNTRCYVTTVTINNPLTWEYKTFTIPGCQDGLWATDSQMGFKVFFTLGSGSSFSTPANVWATTNVFTVPGATNFMATAGNVVCITGVCCFLGIEAPSAIRSPFIMRPYDQELLTCQRYLEIISTSSGAINQFLPSGQASAGNFYAVWRFNVKKRVLPTTQFLGAASWINSVPAAYYALDQIMFYSASWFVGSGGSGMIADARL